MDAIIGTGKISKRQYGIIAQRNIAVRVSDGIDIDVDVFRPDGEGKFPALLGMAPYNKKTWTDRIWPRAMGSSFVSGMSDAGFEAGPTDFFVRRGYVHILAQVRGTGRSGGTYRFMDHREVRDIYDIVEWAAQQPWCTGNVGMAGTSYFGWNQQPAAVLQPPHLKTIGPFFAATDHYRDAWYHGGIPVTYFNDLIFGPRAMDLHTEASVSRQELGEEGFKEALARALQNKDLCAHPQFLASLTNPDMPMNAAKVDVLLHSTDGPYWRERAVTEYDKIKVPAYLGCCWGMYELHLPGAFRSWANLKVPKKMVIGPPIYLDRPVYQYQWEWLRWYDYWLKGIDTGIMDEPPIKLFVTGTGEWKTADDWPIPGTRWIPFNLHSGGILCEIEPWPEAPSASYVDGPSERGGLTYSTAPLVEDTEVIGPMALSLYAAARSREAFFFVSLWDVAPDGTESILTRGWLKGSHREVDPEKSKPWQPYHTHTIPKPLVPGIIYLFNIEIMPTAHLFKVGHRIALKIKGSVDEPPKTLLDYVHAPHIAGQTPTIVTIFHDADHPSHLLLPITKGNIVGTFLSGGDISARKPKIQ